MLQDIICLNKRKCTYEGKAMAQKKQQVKSLHSPKPAKSQKKRQHSGLKMIALEEYMFPAIVCGELKPTVHWSIFLLEMISFQGK